MLEVTLRCYRDSDLNWLEDQARTQMVEYRVHGTCITLWNPPPYLVLDAKARGITEDFNANAKA